MGNPQERLAFDIGWLIGIIDGEGCFSLCKRHDRKELSFEPRFQITNTNLEIIDKVQLILTRLNIQYSVQKYKSKSGKIVHNIVIAGLGRLKIFLDVLYPYFDCRLSQANLLKEFVDLRLSKMKEPYGNDENSIAKLLAEFNK